MSLIAPTAAKRHKNKRLTFLRPMSETGERALQLGPHRTWRCAKRLVGTAVRCASGHNTRETLRRLAFSLSATSPSTTHDDVQLSEFSSHVRVRYVYEPA